MLPIRKVIRDLESKKSELTKQKTAFETQRSNLANQSRDACNQPYSENLPNTLQEIAKQLEQLQKELNPIENSIADLEQQLSGPRAQLRSLSRKSSQLAEEINTAHFYNDVDLMNGLTKALSKTLASFLHRCTVDLKLRQGKIIFWQLDLQKLKEVETFFNSLLKGLQINSKHSNSLCPYYDSFITLTAAERDELLQKLTASETLTPYSPFKIKTNSSFGLD